MRLFCSRYIYLHEYTNRRDSSVHIVMGYRLDEHGSITGRGKKFFSIAQGPDRFWDPPSLLSNGYRGNISPEVKRSELTPSSADVNNSGAIFPLHKGFMLCLIK
jgi:hypothetical protein